MRIGIDLGGTNIAAGIVDDNYQIVAKKSIKTLNRRPADEILADMAQLALDLPAEADIPLAEIEMIGVGSPGIVDSDNGVVLYANNLQFDHVDIRGAITKVTGGKPVFVDNDANCAVLGEFIAGAAKGFNSVVLITLGTGLGGGIILDGKIHKGFNSASNHVGHAVVVSGGVKCTCGRRGCWESYAAVTALIRMGNELADQLPESALATLRARDGALNGRNIFEAGKSGDMAAQDLIQQYFYYISEGLTDLVNILQPEIMLIGGGICKEGDYLLDPVKRHVAENVFCKAVPLPQFRIAALGNDAGIIGAAFLGGYPVGK